MAVHQKSESKSRNRVSARAKLEVSNVFYAYFILKQKNVKYGVFYYFSAVSFNYALLKKDAGLDNTHEIESRDCYVVRETYRVGWPVAPELRLGKVIRGIGGG